MRSDPHNCSHWLGRKLCFTSWLRTLSDREATKNLLILLWGVILATAAIDWTRTWDLSYSKPTTHSTKPPLHKTPTKPPYQPYYPWTTYCLNISDCLMFSLRNNKLTESKVLGADKSSASLPGKSEVNQVKWHLLIFNCPGMA